MIGLDRNSPVPLYHQLKQLLLENIEDGSYPVGKLLPPEMELLREYRVSRATVRRAMQEMEYAGYIQRTPGKGTFVLRAKLKRGLSQLTSFTEDMQERGRTVATQLLEFKTQIPPARVANLMEIRTDTPLIFIYRLRYADNIPMALNVSYLNLPEGINISESDLLKVSSLFSLLENTGIRLIEADKTIESIPANEEYAGLLNMNIGEPLLFVEGIVYTLNHVPVEYHQVISCGERHKYSLHLNR
jgi:GntR family transcriptional regulator